MASVPSLPIASLASAGHQRPRSARERSHSASARERSHSASARERSHSARQRSVSARARPHSARTASVREESEDSEGSTEETLDSDWSDSESDGGSCAMERCALDGLEKATTVEEGMRTLFHNDAILFHKLAWQAHFALTYRLEHGICTNPECEC